MTPEQLGFLELLIVHKELGPIGMTVLAEYRPLHRRAEFLMGLFEPRHRGTRFSVEATLMTFDLAFNRYGLNKLHSYVFTGNKHSQASTLSLGFQQEGILREHIYSVKEQRFLDTYQNGLTEADFRNNPRLAKLSNSLINKDITQKPCKCTVSPIIPAKTTRSRRFTKVQSKSLSASIAFALTIIGSGFVNVAAEPLSGVSKIALGTNKSCIVTNTGGIKCWGGAGKSGSYLGIEASYTPSTVSLNTTATNIAIGSSHACVLTTSGGVKCWGSDMNGQLGNGGGKDYSNDTPSTSVDVSGLTNGVIAIAAGTFHSCALTNTGAVKCWGSNNSGQLGDGSSSDQLAPVNVSGLTSGVTAISASDDSTCALLNDGGVKCWGSNNSGQLGDGATSNKSTPVYVSGLTSGISDIAVGGQHTCALTNTGAVKCWGNNSYGQLGDGTNQSNLSPVDVFDLNDIKKISTGSNHSCALTNNGGVKCWGANNAGQLGDSSTFSKPTPVAVAGLANGITTISARESWNCATTVNNTIKCWGDNYSGQLGDGTNKNANTPIDVLIAPLSNYHPVLYAVSVDVPSNNGGFFFTNEAFATSNYQLKVGDVLTLKYSFFDPDGDKEGNTVIQWYRTSVDDYTGRNKQPITGATGKTYTLTDNDLDKRIGISIIPIALSGVSKGEEYSSFPPNQAPTISNVNIGGIPQVGKPISASYSYSDQEGDPVGTPTIQWYRADKADGTNMIKITGATSELYTPTTADEGKYLAFDIVPVATSGTLQGTITYMSPFKGAVIAANLAPNVTNLLITGISQVGETLTGNYTFIDADNDLEGASIYQWYRADNTQGTNKVEISGATGKTYILTSADVGKSVAFAVKPIALTGISSGTQAISLFTSAITEQPISPPSQCANYNPTIVPQVNMPCVKVGNDVYSVGMNVVPALTGLRFAVDLASLKPTALVPNEECAAYPYNGHNTLRINCVEVSGNKYWANLNLAPSLSAIEFDLAEVGAK